MRGASVLLAVCLASTVSAYSFVDQYMSTTDDAAQFLRGFSKGLIGEDLGEDFGQCIAEGGGLVSDIEEAITKIELGGIENIVEGIFEFIQIAKEIPLILGDCSSISESAIAKISAFAERFSDLNALFYKVSTNMLFHGPEIMSDFNKAKDSINKLDYFNGGLFGGLAINIATQ